MKYQVAKETNANVDLRTGVSSRGVLATAILSTVHGHIPGVDDDLDDDDKSSVSSSFDSEEEDSDENNSDSSYDSEDSEVMEKRKQAKKLKRKIKRQMAKEEVEAIALEEKGGISSQVCGVLELVNPKPSSLNSKRNRGSWGGGGGGFNKKSFQVAELVANEVASLMAHRAREVAFLDPTHGLEAALGAFAIDGSKYPPSL